MNFMKGQGSTEYIVMLAVALIVVLVTAALLGFFPSFSGDAQQSEYDTYWQSASPVSISSAQQSSGTDRNATLVLENKLPKEISITTLSLTNSTGGAATNGTGAILPPGGKVVMRVSSANLATCASRSGKPNLYNVSISYNDGDYTGKTQSGAKPVAVVCQ